jgi:drug/metabolite transporter (DMT)-like permease
MTIQNQDTQPKPLTVAWVATALIAASIEPLIVKLGYKGNATAFQFVVLKLILGGIFIAPIYRQIKWVGFEKFKSMLVLSSCFILNYVLIFYSLKTITASVLVTIITTTPAVVAIVNQFRFKEIAGLKFWSGFSLCFAGVILTIDLFGDNTTLDLWGVMLALFSVGTSALYRTRMDLVTKEVKPITISAYLFMINAVVGVFCLPWLGEVDSYTWQLAAWIGFAGAIANIAFISALKLIGSTRISILTVLQRPLVILLAALVLNEPLTVTQIIGIIMVLLGVQFAKVTKTTSVKDLKVEPVLVPGKG